MNSQSYLFFDKPAKNESECFLLAGGSFEIIDDGGVRTKNLRFVIAEAIPNGTTLVFPSRDNTGPTNYLVLNLNRITGKVDYLP